MIKDSLDVRFNEIAATCSWFKSYGLVSHLIDRFKTTSVVEVGVAYGFHAKFLCENHSDLEYIGVDPYVPGYDPDDAFERDVRRHFESPTAAQSFDRLYTAVLARLNRHKNASLLRMTSNAASMCLLEFNTQPQLVYLDGSHKFDAVLDDLNKWWPIVKHGGVLCGDDFTWPGVRGAVEVFAKERNVKCRFVAKQDRQDFPLYYFEKGDAKET